MGTVGHLQGAAVALKAAKETAGDAAQIIDRRVIGMDADVDAGILGYRHHALHKVGIVIPELLLRVAPAVGQRHKPALVDPPALLGILQMKGAPLGASAHLFAAGAPNTIGHMGIGRVMDARRAQVAYVLEIGGDLFLTSRQAQRHLLHVVAAMVMETIDPEPVILKAFL